MFLEHRGYIIDPKKRSLNLTQITSTVSGWHSFGDWELVDNELKCHAGWMALVNNQ